MSLEISEMTLSTETEGKAVRVDKLYLDEIPGAMDKMGWKVSAALMRRWFATKPAWVMSPAQRTEANFAGVPSSRIDNQLVKMDWLLSHESVLSAFDQLSMTWNSVPGRDQLKKRLYRAGWVEGSRTRLGYGVRTAMRAEMECQVNFIEFGAYRDTFNDLFGAVNRGLLKLAVKGQTETSPITATEVFAIEKIGVYCRDTYDFNAEWFTDNTVGLGVWSRDRCLSKAETIAFLGATPSIKASRFSNFVSVQNADFRRWQQRRNEGGDFYVFSDILWLEPHVDHVRLA